PWSQPPAIVIGIIPKAPCRSWASSSQSMGCLGQAGSGIVAPFPLAGERADEALCCSAVGLGAKAASGSVVCPFAVFGWLAKTLVQPRERIDVTPYGLSLTTGDSLVCNQEVGGWISLVSIMS